jgi:DNA-binding NarL/FixJ family response regulator
MKMDRTCIQICCCNRLLRELITRMLSKRPEFDVLVSGDSSCKPADEIAADGVPVVVVFDSLDSYLETLLAETPQGLREAAPRCLLVAMEDDHGNFLAAVRSGAWGYVLQDASASDVLAAIRAVAGGRAVCPSGYSRVLFDYVAGRTHESPSNRRRAKWGLTRREQQLIPLVGRGLTNKEIAAEFNLSERTVKNHIHRIFKKVGVTDRLALYEVWQNRAAPPSQNSIHC